MKGTCVEVRELTQLVINSTLTVFACDDVYLFLLYFHPFSMMFKLL